MALSPLPSSLTRACDDLQRDRATALADQEARQRMRRAISAVDDLIDDVEDVNLQRGSKTPARVFKAQLLDLEDTAGPAPAMVRAARTTARLHAALMDWLEDLLNDAIPERAHYAECEEDAA